MLIYKEVYTNEVSPSGYNVNEWMERGECRHLSGARNRGVRLRWRDRERDSKAEIDISSEI
jgi:hypothetical protein